MLALWRRSRKGKSPPEGKLGVQRPAMEDPTLKAVWVLLFVQIILAIIFFPSSPIGSIGSVLTYCVCIALRYWLRRGVQPVAELSPESIPDSAVLYLRPLPSLPSVVAAFTP